MLPRERRLRHRADLLATQRRGRRAGGSLLVVHLLSPADSSRTDPPNSAPASGDGPDVEPRAGSTSVVAPRPAHGRAGVVVSRAVGCATVRNRVKRRLRHLLASRLDGPYAGCDLVVRARPGAAAASSAALGGELDRALSRLVRR